MDDEKEKDEPQVQAEDNSISIGRIHIDGDVSGNITIGHGYTAEQVSILLKEITTTFQPKPFDGRCPYKGLDVFEEEDAELFFGRERLVEDLVSRVKESRTVFITGPSGSGKSSLVRAGLIHALKQGAIKDLHSERWLYETMKPGREPIKDLALAFSRLKSPELSNYFLVHKNEINILNECSESVLSGQTNQRFVLFVDQFEEVFTQVNQDEERLAFLNMLAHAATVENGRVIVLFAMRSDFVSNCATYPMLNELLSQEFMQIGAMQPEELVSAIALPARHVGLPIEDELIARIINDMKGEPGALPLMQFALKDLFDSQQEKGGVLALTLKDYLQHGGIHKSLERHANATFAKLSENEQGLARSIFSGLIEIGRGTQDTKRTALFDELIPANTKAEDVGIIVQKLADARLIITDEQAGKDTVTISHEKLIDAWPWLKKLVNENRDVIALQNEITSDAKEWDEHQRDPSYLYTGARLANAREQLEAKKLALSGFAESFIEAGAKAYSDELEAARQRTIQLRRRSAYLTTALVVAIVAVGIAVFFSVQSRQQLKISRAGELAALALSEKDTHFDLALLFGVEGLRTLEKPRTENALLTLMESHPGLDYYLSGDSPVSSVAFSPDGRYLASGGADATIILWDISDPSASGKLATLIGHSNYVSSIIFSPDGKTLASGSHDTTIILWDISDPSAPSKLAILSGHDDPVISIAFSPDGKTLASGSDATIILWDVSNSSDPVELATLLQPTNFISNIIFSPDGKTLASGGSDYGIALWDVHDPSAPSELAILSGHDDPVISVAFSPNGEMLASGGYNATIILWDVTDPTAPIELSTFSGHSNSVSSLIFSPDGKTLASGSYDTTIILWDVSNSSDPTRLTILLGHYGLVTSATFSPDGKTLASGSYDTTIILWDVSHLSTPSKFATLTLDNGAGYSVGFSPDGRTLASGSAALAIILWDVGDPSDPSKFATLSGHSASANSVAFSPNGKHLASGSNDAIILWDVSDPSAPIKLATLPGHINTLSATITFSPDGRYLASGGDDATIILWDISDPSAPFKTTTLSGHNDIISSVAFSPDGKHLASGSNDAIIWDISDPSAPGKLATLSRHNSGIVSVAFSPDGKTLAAGKADTTIILWDVSDPSAPSQLTTLTGHNGIVSSVAFSPKGKLLASGSDDSSIILWDVSDRSAPAKLAILSGHKGSISRVAFSPDGKTLASGSLDATVILWDVDPQSWVKKACRRAGRNFTQAEWAQYFPNEEYRATCPQWPLEPIPTLTP